MPSSPVKKLKRPARPYARWITARKIVQGLALAAFLALFIASRRGGWSANLVNFPMRLDPLAVLSHLVASRTLLAGSALALIVIALTLLAGRAWCGWLCPLGTVLDIFPFKRRGKNQTEPSNNWRAVKYSLLVAMLVAALFGNLTLLFLDPLTLLIRTLTVAVWPALDRVVSAVEGVLYAVPALNGPVTALDQALRPAILPAVPVYYRDTVLFGAVFFTVIALNLFAPRFWCRYLCPLGALLGLLSKAAVFRRTVAAQDCKGCALCDRACPTGTIDPSRGFASDPGECTMCLECLPACPRSSITFTPRLQPSPWEAYDPGRRAVLGSFAAAVTGVALLRSDSAARRDHARLIRPPGAAENDLLSKCLRCGGCMRACPTSALQPSVSESGLEGLWTPVLLTRLGYCDYACNACGQVCPVEAIPPLLLEEKRTKVIGQAYIDENRCIAWADHRDCIVCEEMCPIPNKAIQLKETRVELVDGSTVTVKLPHVLRDLCIGCGICEYKCPLNGQSGIIVYAPNAIPPF